MTNFDIYEHYYDDIPMTPQSLSIFDDPDFIYQNGYKIYEPETYENYQVAFLHTIPHIVTYTNI